MMIQEFINLTGFYPSAHLYAVIEAEYIKSDYPDKQSFCRAYKLNADGLADKIAMLSNEVENMRRKEQEHTKDVALRAAKEWQEEAERLQKELDKELEWKTYEVKYEYSEEAYDMLYDDSSTKKLSTEDAKDLIASEFGFDRSKVEVEDSKRIYEINKHRQVRGSGRVSRAPLYNSTDWNYIRFKVAGYEYEMQDGELCKM